MPGKLHDSAGQHVDCGGEEVSALLEHFKYINWKSSENGPVDEILRNFKQEMSKNQSSEVATQIPTMKKKITIGPV